MTAKLLKKSFDNYYHFPLSVWNTIAWAGTDIAVEKERVLKEADKTERYLNFILEGSIGILLWNKNKFRSDCHSVE